VDGNTQQERAGAHSPRTALLILVAGMVLYDLAGVYLTRSTPALLTTPAVPVWIVTIAFAITTYIVIDIPTAREKFSINIAELPLVFSLFFLTPSATVLAFIAGATLPMILSWRLRGVKLAFNFAQFALQAVTAVLVFRLVLGDAPAMSPRAWIGAGVATLASDVCSVELVSLAAWLHSRAFDHDVALWTMVTSGTAAMAKTAVALLAVIALQVHVPDALVLVVIITAVMYLCFRMYAFLYLRYQRVEMLYRFTGAIAGAVDLVEVSECVVRDARDLLRAEAVELALCEPAGLIVTIDDANTISRRQLANEDVGAAMETLLALHGEDYALITSFGGETTTGWLAVVRGIDHEQFEVADRRLFEALANHTSVAVENGRLLDQVSAAARQREHRALHDALTELPNRVHLTDGLTSAIAAAAPSQRVALLMVGLDDFREVNETLGHEHGDTVLRQVASRLRELSQGDWTAARVGGDEFAILVPDAGAVGAAVRIGESIVHAFEEPFHVAGLVIALSARVGVALTPDHGESAEEILRRAEIALRTAKVRHAQVNAFLLGDDPHSPRQLVLAHELRRAIEDEALAVHVQPQLELDTEMVRCVEVLARWQRDDQVIPPDEFIPVAERTGLIRPLTGYILDRALAHRKQWAAAGYDIDIAVNVSVRDLVDPAFPEQVAVALTRGVCPARALRLEITETQIMTEPQRVAAALRRLAILGVAVSIDDFGTGYSSLSSVRELAVDEVKIDRSFVSNAANDPQDGTLVKSITELGHGLGLRVVAEGVEDDATLELLRSIGVDAVQGYGISRPLPAVDFPGWLAYRDEYVGHRG
jgi:diguanylate cyclase (GGDEF)-like protein